MTYPTPIRCIYLRKQTVSEITVGNSGISNLPSGNVVLPNQYYVYGQLIDMRNEGLYVISDFNGRCTQVISYFSDLEALLSGICYLIQQGTDDNNLTISQMLSISLSRKLVMTCGVSSKFAQAILKQAYIQCRLVGGLAGGNYNGYDDGHLAIEIFNNNNWVYIDIDKGQSVWLDTIGSIRANLLDLHLNLNRIIFDPLTVGMGFEVINFAQFPFLIIKQNLNLLAWYSQIFQVPYQIISGKNYFYNDNSQYATNVENYSLDFISVSPSNFINYYPISGSNVTHALSIPDMTTNFGTSVYTWFDSSHPITNGKIITSIGAYLINPISSLIPVIGQKNIDGTISIVANGLSNNHPGNGWVDFMLNSNYTIPSDGTYLCGYTGAIGNNSFVSVGSRARYSGVMTGNNNNVNYYFDGTIAMRWTEAH